MCIFLIGASTIVIIFDAMGIIIMGTLFNLDLYNAVHTNFSGLHSLGDGWIAEQTKHGIRTIMLGVHLVRNRDRPESTFRRSGALGHLYTILLMKHFVLCGLSLAVAKMRRKVGMTNIGLSVGGHKEGEVKLEWMGDEVLDVMLLPRNLVEHYSLAIVGDSFDHL